MDTTLQVTRRDQAGKGWARKVRAQGKIPAVVYGRTTEAQSVTVDPAALSRLFNSTGDRNTIVDLKVDDAAGIPCMVREVQRHPVGRQLLHVDFYAVPLEESVEVMVPVTTVGKAKGALMGGRIRLIRRSVKVSCRYDRIPTVFEVDVTDLDIGDMITASQISLPEGVEMVFDNDYNVVTLYGKKVRATKTEE